MFQQRRVRGKTEDYLQIADDTSSEVVQGIHLLTGEVPFDRGYQGLKKKKELIKGKVVWGRGGHHSDKVVWGRGGHHRGKMVRGGGHHTGTCKVVWGGGEVR